CVLTPSDGAIVERFGVSRKGRRGFICEDHSLLDDATTRWCNGSTIDFGSICPGSNPGRVGMSLTAIILAGGKSTRMKTKRPKPLHEICGKPMLTYILRACYAAGCERILCVVGNGKDEIMAAFGDDKRVHFVEQAEQLGTGHAAQMCVPELKKQQGGDVIMLAAD